jgi:hypothetical protein
MGILVLELVYGNPPFGYFNKESGDQEKFLKEIIDKSDEQI